MLDDIVEWYHRAGIILIYRPNEASLEWWLQAGGFNITYPNYDYYKDEKTMAKHIANTKRCYFKVCS